MVERAALVAGALAVLAGMQRRLGEPRRPGQQPRALGRVGQEHASLEQLGHDAVDQVALQYSPAGAQHGYPHVLRPLLGDGEQARLADAGDAAHQDQRPLAGARGGHGGLEQLDLCVAFEQWPPHVHAGKIRSERGPWVRSRPWPFEQGAGSAQRDGQGGHR